MSNSPLVDTTILVMADALESRHDAAAALALFSLRIPDEPVIIAGAVARLAMNADADFPLDHVIDGLKSDKPMGQNKARRLVQLKVTPGHAGHWLADGKPSKDLTRFGRALKALAPMFDDYVDELVEALEYINTKEYAAARYAHLAE